MNRIAAVVAGLLLAFVGTCASFAATINVPDDQPTIQDAITAADDGDTVLIAPGTIEGDNALNINLQGKAITIRGTRSSDGSFLTTMSPGVSYSFTGPPGEMYVQWSYEGPVFICNSNENSSTIIKDLAFTAAANPTGGGVISISSSSPTIDNCSFNGCGEQLVEFGDEIQVEATYGGAIHCNGGNTTISNCSFTGCEAETGGAIYSNSNLVTITDCMFSNCTSMYTISSCGNLPNVGSSVGGAVFTVGDAIITNCKFTSNTATPSQSEDDIACSGSISQRAVGFGGALTCNGNLNMSNCYLYGNNSANGGAMFIGGSGDYVSLTNCVFKENTSITSGFGNYGGAVNVSNNRSTPITFTGCLFESNAASLGGAILCPNENQDSTIACQFDDCRFSNNQATQNSGLPDLEPYGYGGSVCLAGPTNFIFTDCTFEENESWDDGGAINVQYSGSTLTMDGCELRSNSCGNGSNGYGGAIRLYDEAVGSFSDCDISNNTADQYGGGISVRNGSYLQISNCTLAENTATNDDGGGIYFDSATGTVTYTTVFGNNSDGDGGGIHIRDAVPAAIIEYCHVTNNTTGDHGGGIWAYSESDLSLTNTTVCNNTSSDDDSTSQVDPDDYYCCGNTIQDTCSATCPGDLNFDGIIDVADLLILIAEWDAGESIQIDTLLTILSEFGQPCPD